MRNREHPAFIETGKLSEARVYHLRFEQGGWALISVCDEKGMLGIVSDWGNWAFNWDPKGISRATFTEFLTRASAQYVANKILSTKECDSFDEHETLLAFKKNVFERRRDGRLDRDEARRMYDEICDHSDGEHGIHELAAYIGIEDSFEWIVTSPTPTYYVFVECIWPAFQSVLRDEEKTRDEVRNDALHNGRAWP